MIEILRSLPELPLWLALSAALPANWSPILVFFGITIILGLLDWPGLARAVRSKLLSLREEDFVKAAELMGASKQRIISRHLIPNFMSHLIASATLSIPSMILGETALSFLGLGLRPPITSWGVLLNEAQNLAAVQLHPWLLFPIIPVVIVVLAFNFMGDGIAGRGGSLSLAPLILVPKNSTRLKSRHLATLTLIYKRPVSGSVPWRAIEGLFIALGAELSEREGSRVAIFWAGEVRVFHRPHPLPDTDKGALASVRKWLESNGVGP